MGKVFIYSLECPITGQVKYSKTYSIVNPEGETIVFKNASDFCKKFNINIGHFSMLRRGLVKTAKGFTEAKIIKPA